MGDIKYSIKSFSSGHSLTVIVSQWVKKIAKASTLFKMDKQQSLSFSSKFESIWLLDTEYPD